MTEETPKTGLLPEPVFVRGFDPAKNHWTRPLKNSPWTRHFELCRQNPGKWAMVSEIKKGGCKARLIAIQSDRNKIARYLDRRFPLERWTMRNVTVEGTWCDRQLYLRYDGILTPEEDVEDRRVRREAWQAKNHKIMENRARRAQEARDKAAEQEAAQRLQIRARRKPGG